MSVLLLSIALYFNIVLFAGGHSGHADHKAVGADPSCEDHADDTPLNTTCNMEPAPTICVLYLSVFISQYFQQEFLYPRIHVSVIVK